MLLPNVNSQSTFPHPNQLQCAFSEANNKRKNTLAITPPKLTQFLDNNILHWEQSEIQIIRYTYLFHCKGEFTNKSSLDLCISYQVLLSF